MQDWSAYPGKGFEGGPLPGMRRIVIAPALLAVLLVSPAPGSPQRTAQGTNNRAVAFTFDDLPASRTAHLDDMREVTVRLLEHLRADSIPAIGFVNEGKLARAGEEDSRKALLEAWLDAGHDLGNHTFSHMRFYDATLAEYQADVLRGERVTRTLMTERGRQLRYFRHPTLNTGRDLETKKAFEQFLADHGYVVAPVTIDNDEYLYASAYDRARARGDAALMRRLGQDYLRYMREVFQFYEALSARILGREIPQVLLLHANRLNGDYLDDLVETLKLRGYRFVSLDHALADPAYEQPDGYAGPRGISWIQRWAITRGDAPGEQPSAPDWVSREAQAR